jgi:FtsP/CotA-like multicopper oxidase with cupredoxin domain
MEHLHHETTKRRRRLDRGISRRGLVGLGAAAIAGVGGTAIGLKTGFTNDATAAVAAPPPAHGVITSHAAHAPHAAQVASPEATPAPPPFAGVSGEPLTEPPVRTSANGVLETTLEAKVGPAKVAGKDVTSYVYEGSFPGPTLRLHPGDTLKVQLVNGLDDITNLHTHGFHVSPRDNSDNIFLHINPGETFDYEYKLPADHSPGMYWYHPHGHGNTGKQTNGGMAGVILIDGGLDEVPGIAGLTERLLILQGTEFDGNGNLIPYDNQSNVTRQRFVNGQLNPTIAIRPGETQRWRIANISSDNFFLLALAGHQLHQIASDGNPFDVVVPRDQILIAPSERVEVLVQASTQPGSYELRTLLWGEDYQAEPDQLLATMAVAGEAMTPAPLPTALIPYEDLRNVPVDNVRVTTFEEPPAPLYLAIDGKHFDPNRVDQTVKLGATEEWIVRNTSSEWHPFHIHVNDFQVVARDGVAVDSHGYQDTVPLPPNSETTIRMKFLDFSGKFVYHCHILSHEDFGMMAVVEVVE